MSTIPTATPADVIAERIHDLDWSALTADLDDRGFALTDRVYTTEESRHLAGLFDGDGFRSTIDMARHRFGDGRYRYFDYPLPEEIQGARTAFYERLAPVANVWGERLSGDQPTFPDSHEELLALCREAGQERPTPLILRYGEGDWNALHQDLYGDIYFPFQVLTVLSDRSEYEGGEFVLVEQRPRAQSRAQVIRPEQGAFVIFPTRERPHAGTRGDHRIGLRHGVSTLTSGQRTALGIIFHDAR
jgi:uncharacterized protein